MCKNDKPETMLYNFAKIINWNDISNINYTVRVRNNHTLKALSDRFFENVIFYCMVPIYPYNKSKEEYLSKFLAN